MMLPRRARGLGTFAVTLALLAAIGTAGVVDHTLKQRRMNRAEESQWYCTHTQTRCGGPSSIRIENAWNQRERGYQIALGVVAAAGVALAIVARSRRSSPATPRSQRGPPTTDGPLRS
jgi:hypothetical protein